MASSSDQTASHKFFRFGLVGLFKAMSFLAVSFGCLYLASTSTSYFPAMSLTLVAIYFIIRASLPPTNALIGFAYNKYGKRICIASQFACDAVVLYGMYLAYLTGMSHMVGH
jgi:hypothetical protein